MTGLKVTNADQPALHDIAWHATTRTRGERDRVICVSGLKVEGLSTDKADEAILKRVSVIEVLKGAWLGHIRGKLSEDELLWRAAILTLNGEDPIADESIVHCIEDHNYSDSFMDRSKITALDASHRGVLVLDGEPDSWCLLKWTQMRLAIRKGKNHKRRGGGKVFYYSRPSVVLAFSEHPERVKHFFSDVCPGDAVVIDGSKIPPYAVEIEGDLRKIGAHPSMGIKVR